VNAPPTPRMIPKLAKFYGSFVAAVVGCKSVKIVSLVGKIPSSVRTHFTRIDNQLALERFVVGAELVQILLGD